jgi:hypothetical protein
VLRDSSSCPAVLKSPIRCESFLQTDYCPGKISLIISVRRVTFCVLSVVDAT